MSGRVKKTPKFLQVAVLMLSGFTLAGCAHKIQYQRIACISQEQLNELKAQRPGAIRDKLTGQADKDLLIVTGKLIRVEAWGAGLLDVLGNCAG